MERAVPTVADLDPAEREDYLRLLLDAFLVDPTPESLAVWRPLFDVGRFQGVHLDGRLIGGGGVLHREITVPGAHRVPLAAVTGVGVRPDARRRGALGALMRHQLHTEHERGGAPVAALWSSQGPLYGRFGYEVGVQRAAVEVPTGARERDDLAPREAPGAVRALDPASDAGRDALRAVHAAARDRPGVLDRPEPSWGWWFDDTRPAASGTGSLRVAVHHTPTGAPDGYVAFRIKRSDAEAAVEVHELMAASAGADRALWEHLLALDLVARVRWRLAPSDLPLPHRLADPRVVERSVGDALWVRLIDVDRALAARSLTAGCDVVVGVSDALCPWNDGRWRVVAGPGERPRVTRSDAAPDVALDVRVLSAAWLGGVTVATLADAGRVEECRPGAVAELSRALAGDVPPWTPEVF